MELKITGYNKWDLSVKKEVLYEFAWSLRAKINRLFKKDERQENPVLEALYQNSIKDSGRLLETNDPIEILNIEGRLDGLKNMIPVLEGLRK